MIADISNCTLSDWSTPRMEHRRSEELMTVTRDDASNGLYRKHLLTLDDMCRLLDVKTASNPALVDVGCCSPPPVLRSPISKRWKLVVEGEVQVCRVFNSRKFMNKLVNSKYLRRWETHLLNINDDCLASRSRLGYMDSVVPYSELLEVCPIGCWEGLQKYCLRLVLSNGLLVLQMSNPAIRDQWYHSIVWKKRMFQYRRSLLNARRLDSVISSIKTMITYCVHAPLKHEYVLQYPMDVISQVLSKLEFSGDRLLREELIIMLEPLLEQLQPSEELCRFLGRFCSDWPRSPLLMRHVLPVIAKILKHNVDFSKNRLSRELVQEFLYALSVHDNGVSVTRTAIQRVHGEGSVCPHPRVLPNLVATCLGAVFLQQETSTQPSETRSTTPADDADLEHSASPERDEDDAATEARQQDDDDTGEDDGRCSTDRCCSTEDDGTVSYTDYSTVSDACDGDTVSCQSLSVSESQLNHFLFVIATAAEYDDWRPGLAMLLQPIPFPDTVLTQTYFSKYLSGIVGLIGRDSRCEVHKAVLSTREGKRCWLKLVCPSSPSCPDEGQLWSTVLKTLLSCCCRRKAFVKSLLSMLDTCQLLALRSDGVCQDVLCLMLEWGLLDDPEKQSMAASTLLSSPSGKQRYQALCDGMEQLKKLQSAGGPQSMCLPSRSTDQDVAQLLAGGCLGNLQVLSLAFTSVTSQCAKHIIKLPNLRSLNLWSTQFGDSGLMLITEHLTKLQVLNLCETFVTEKSIITLTALKELRQLNLNSTNLSAETLAELKRCLPNLKEVDVRYTDAW